MWYNYYLSPCPDDFVINISQACFPWPWEESCVQLGEELWEEWYYAEFYYGASAQADCEADLP